MATTSGRGRRCAGPHPIPAGRHRNVQRRPSVAHHAANRYLMLGSPEGHGTCAFDTATDSQEIAVTPGSGWRQSKICEAWTLTGPVVAVDDDVPMGGVGHLQDNWAEV